MSAPTSSPPIRAVDPAIGDLYARVARQHRYLLWRAQKMAFWVLYDYAGPFFILNMLTLAIVLGPAWLLSTVLGVPVPFVVALTLMLGVAASAGQAGVVVRILADETFSYRQFFIGATRLTLRALGLFSVALSIGVMAFLGAWFYPAHLMATQPWAAVLLTGLCISGGALVALVSVYLLPALVNQRGSMGRALKTAVHLAHGYPLITAGLAILTVAQALLMVTPPGLLLLSALPPIALGCCTYELIARRCKVEEALAGGETLEALAKAGGLLDDDDVFLNRGFREFLFPWKE